MVHFIIGGICGFVLGMVIMCLCAAASQSDREEERREK